MKESTLSKVMAVLWAIVAVMWIVDIAQNDEGRIVKFIAFIFCIVICALYWQLWMMQEKAEKIVRCWYCRRVSETVKFSNGDNGSSFGRVLFCDKHRCETRPDFTCSWGVRK